MKLNQKDLGCSSPFLCVGMKQKSAGTCDLFHARPNLPENFLATLNDQGDLLPSRPHSGLSWARIMGSGRARVGPFLKWKASLPGPRKRELYRFQHCTPSPLLSQWTKEEIRVSESQISQSLADADSMPPSWERAKRLPGWGWCRRESFPFEQTSPPSLQRGGNAVAERGNNSERGRA